MPRIAVNHWLPRSQFVNYSGQLVRRAVEVCHFFEPTIVQLDLGFELPIPGALDVSSETEALVENVL
jgi:hypothetical protein